MPKKSARRGPALPAILEEFSKWLGAQENNAVGHFELSDDPPGEGWFGDAAVEAKLAQNARGFARLPDGSEIILVDPGAQQPLAVVLLGSEGEQSTLATSPEQFLTLLAKGETGNSDLDDEDATGRKALAAWLAKRKVKIAKAKDFDLGSFLDGGAKPLPAPLPPKASALQAFAKLPPRTRRLATLVGRRADDPELTAFVKDELKKKLPVVLGGIKDYEYVEMPKQGFSLLFEYNVRHDAYPIVTKSSRSHVTYLAAVHFLKAYKDALPFGVTADMSVAAASKLLGASTGERGIGVERAPYWIRPLDAERGIVFAVVPDGDELQVSIQVDAARELSEHGHPPKPIVGLFVAWAIQRGLFDRARFAEHATLIDGILAGKARGSALLDAALPRGLWDQHLLDLPELRDFAFGWFHNIGDDGYVLDTLGKVFGNRRSEHAEVALDDDSPAALAKAAPALDRVFKRWLSSTKKAPKSAAKKSTVKKPVRQRR